MLDQHNKADGGKSSPTLLQTGLVRALKAVNAVLDYGAQKYERNGWKAVDPARYDDAARRHQISRDMGEEHDDESGLLHLAHEATNILFQLEMKIKRMEENGMVHRSPYVFNKPPTGHRVKSESIAEIDRLLANNRIAERLPDGTFSSARRD